MSNGDWTPIHNIASDCTWPNTTTGGYSCTLCGQWVGWNSIHNCWANPNTLPPNTFPMTIPQLEKLVATTKDINWKEFIPARPPESGEYLIVVQDKKDPTNKDWSFSKWDKDKYEWSEKVGPGWILTHYSKLELP